MGKAAWLVEEGGTRGYPFIEEMATVDLDSINSVEWMYDRATSELVKIWKSRKAEVDERQKEYVLHV